MAEKSRVHCSHPSGAHLRLYDMVEGPFGIKSAAPRGEIVHVPAGESHVDSEFLRQWLAQNPESQLIRKL